MKPSATSGGITSASSLIQEEASSVASDSNGRATNRQQPPRGSSAAAVGTAATNAVVRLSGRFWAAAVVGMLAAAWATGRVARWCLHRRVVVWAAANRWVVNSDLLGPATPPPHRVALPSRRPRTATASAPWAEKDRQHQGGRRGRNPPSPLKHVENKSDSQWSCDEPEGRSCASPAMMEASIPTSPGTLHRAEARAPPSRTDGTDHAEESEEGFARPLVHRTLLAHPKPRKVAVLVGAREASAMGVGRLKAVLREVLRHTTVDDVVLVRFPNAPSSPPLEDEAAVDDERVRVLHHQDPASWLLGVSDSFDVILLAHDNLWDYTHSFRNDVSRFVGALTKALRNPGCVGLISGPMPQWKDPPHRHADALAFVDAAQHRFASILDYSAGRGRSGLVLLTDRELHAEWRYESSAEVNLKIRRRIRPPSTTSTSLQQDYLDGASIMGYKFPTRLHEELWCRRVPAPSVCRGGHGIDPEPADFSASTMHVKTSTFGERSGRGVFATQRIPKGSYVGLKECLESLLLPPSTNDVLWSCREKLRHPFFSAINTYFEGYGWLDNTWGAEAEGVETATPTFCNHGCNGTYNIGLWLPLTEQSVPVGAGPAAAGLEWMKLDPYDPVSGRRFPSFDCDTSAVALRDIEAGEEILDNYLVFGGSESDAMWEMNLAELKAVCSGQAIGLVKAYEEEQKRARSGQNVPTS